MGCEGAGNRVRDPLMPTLTLRKRLRRARVAGPTTRRRNGAFSRGARGDAPRKKTAFSRGARGDAPRKKTTRGRKVPHGRRLRLRPWSGPARRPCNKRPRSLALPGHVCSMVVPQIYADAGLTEGYLRGGDSSKSRPCRLASTRRRFHAIHSSCASARPSALCFSITGIT